MCSFTDEHPSVLRHQARVEEDMDSENVFHFSRMSGMWSIDDFDHVLDVDIALLRIESECFLRLEFARDSLIFH